MNDSEPEVAVSPVRAGNFVLACSEEETFIRNIQSDSLIQFLDGELNSEAREVCDTDSSFFPRAFTEIDIIEQNVVRNDHISVNLKSKSADIKSEGHKDSSMASKSGAGLRDGFQPDVIVSNSRQRSGPDGSPALVPTVSQRFATNLSETGELFAPVRTLTFSDIDQSSHMEDSYLNTSRFVSTPTKSEHKPGNYDYSSMHNRLPNTEVDEDAQAIYSDSSESDNLMINGMRDCESPEFRHLEGEADNNLTNTGPFHPSAHGLSKEFMDNFVGKTGNQASMCDNGDIFSPMRSNSYDDRQENSVTPPLHSSRRKSPYTKNYGSPREKRSPRDKRSPRGRPSPKGQAEPEDDPDEIQFAMSPTKNHQDFHPFDREILGLGDQNGYQQRQNSDNGSREKFYFGKQTSENTFKPIENHSHGFNPATVPKNLNEYFEQVTSDEFLINRGQQNRSLEKEEIPSDMESRQGDGVDNDSDQRPQKLPTFSNGGDHFAPVSPSAFEKRYLQRTQVSVKLPQATYDTLSANTSRDERFTSSELLQHDREEASGFPPDVTASGGSDAPLVEHMTKSSPGKVMDLLQNQVTKLKVNSEEVNDGCRDKEVKYSNNNAEAMCISAKSRDTNDAKLKKSLGLRNDQHLQNHESLENSVSPDNIEQTDSNVNNFSEEHKQNSKSAVVKSATRPESDTVRQTQSSQASGQSQLPVTSRLLQETVSQRNKTTQKFVSSAPGPSKPIASSQSKDFKKPFDVASKSQTVACSGARKTLTSETCPKFKVSDKTKPKSVSNESLNNKPKTANQSRNNNYSNNAVEKNALSRFNSQSAHHFVQSQGHGNVTRGQQSQSSQGHLAGRGEGHNRSSHSIEDESQGRIVTQVETISPVPVEQPRKTVAHRQVGLLVDK